MAKHEVIIRENTSTTKTEAPYIPQYVKKNDLAFDALCSQIAAEAGLTETQIRAILEGAFAEFEALEQESAVRIHVDGMTVALAIYGSFPSSDAAFDPLKNTLELAIYLDDDIRYALANVTPSIVTDETATKVRITLVADETTPRPYEVIYGQRVFEVQGYNLVMTDTGAAVELVAENGTVFPCTVVEAVSKQKLRVKSATLLEAGDYKLYVKSRGGDSEGTLQSPFRRVKYIYVAPPPGITKSKQGTLADNTNQFSSTPIVLTGNFPGGFQSGDQLELNGPEGSTPGEYQTTISYEDDVTASDETEIHLGNGIENKRETQIPTSDWIGHNAQWVFRRNGVSYPLVVSWVA